MRLNKNRRSNSHNLSVREPRPCKIIPHFRDTVFPLFSLHRGLQYKSADSV